MSLHVPCRPSKKIQRTLWSRLPIFMVTQPSSLRLRGVGKQGAPSRVLEDLVDPRALAMVVGRPAVSHHLDKETADCDEVSNQPISYKRQLAWNTHDV